MVEHCAHARCALHSWPRDASKAREAKPRQGDAPAPTSTQRAPCQHRRPFNARCPLSGVFPVPPDCAIDATFDLNAFQGRWYISGKTGVAAATTHVCAVASAVSRVHECVKDERLGLCHRSLHV